MRHGMYRPTAEDMTNDAKWQQLSLRDAGKYDWTKWGAAQAARKAGVAASAPPAATLSAVPGPTTETAEAQG